MKRGSVRWLIRKEGEGVMGFGIREFLLLLEYMDSHRKEIFYVNFEEKVLFFNVNFKEKVLFFWVFKNTC